MKIYADIPGLLIEMRQIEVSVIDVNTLDIQRKQTVPRVLSFYGAINENINMGTSHFECVDLLKNV